MDGEVFNKNTISCYYCRRILATSMQLIVNECQFLYVTM